MYKVWTLDDVKKVFDEVVREHGLSIDNIPITISSRMTRCLGMCCYIKMDGNIVTTQFKFSKLLLDGHYPEEVVKEVIKHEYAHHYTNVTLNKDCHHDENFKRTCRMLGISDSTYFEHNDKAVNLPKAKYTIRCKKCGYTIDRHRTTHRYNKDTIEKYCTCGRCRGKLEFIQNY